MPYGSGDFIYELDEGWGKLPDGYEFHQVAGVAVDSSDNVYLFNRSEHQLMVFDREGNFLNSWDQKFSGPHGIYIDEDDNIFLVDRDAHVILKYNSDGELLLTLGTRNKPSDTGYTTNAEPIPRAAGPFNLPTNVAVAEDGTIFVADGYGNCRVHKYSPSGTLMMSWGTPGKVNQGDFHLPHGIEVNSDGNVVVCDRENHRIQIFDQDGVFLTMWTDFRQPTDVLEGPDGEYYVSELQHRLSIVDKDGNIISRWGGDRDFTAGQFVAPHGVAVDSRGDIYISEVLEGKRIQKFIRRR